MASEKFVRGEVLQRALPHGGREVFVAIHRPAKDGSRGELIHYEVHYKAHAGAKTVVLRLEPEQVREIFERFNIRPERKPRCWPPGNGKQVRDTLRYAEHQPPMDYRRRPKSATARRQGHTRDTFFLVRGLPPPATAAGVRCTF